MDNITLTAETDFYQQLSDFEERKQQMEAAQAYNDVWLHDRSDEAKARVDANANAAMYALPMMQDAKGMAMWGREQARMVAPQLADTPVELAQNMRDRLVDAGMKERYTAQMATLEASGQDSADDWYSLYAEMNRDVVQKAWDDHQAVVAERKQEVGGLLLDLVRKGEFAKKGDTEWNATWNKFFDGKSRGVWRDEDETSVKKAAAAWDMMESMLDDYDAAGSEVLTNATTPSLIMQRLRGDEMAEGLFFATLQDRLASMKSDAEKENFLVRFGEQFDASGQKLAAGLMGGHYKAFVTDEQVEEYNAELEKARQISGLENPNVEIYAEGDNWLERMLPVENARIKAIRVAAEQSGQMNEDGSLRKMTDEESQATMELNQFRGKLDQAVNGIYDVGGIAARLGQMLPSSAAFLVPGGAAASFVSMRTQNMAKALGKGEDWTRASVTSTVDAAIQTAVEKIAFGSLKPTKMAFGLDKLMSQKLVARALGGIYGTTAGRIGLGAAAGLAEETFVEPTAALLLAGVYNAAASTEFDLQDPVGEWKNEIEQMVQPDQLLATAVYGLLLGGVNVAGHNAAARDYREVLADLVELGVDEGKAAAIARQGNTVQRTKAIVGVLNERLKVDAGEVMALVAEKYPQLEGLSVMENLHDKDQLPKLLPAGDGQVKVLQKDKEGNVEEAIMSEAMARTLIQSRLEDLDVQTQLQVADMVLANTMVGTLSKDGQRWVISPETEKMDHAYFQRLSHAAGLRLREGAKAEDIDTDVHPHIPLGRLAEQGKAWDRRLKVARHDREQELGRKMTEDEWKALKDTLWSQVNRVGVRGQDGSLRTVLRVARGGFGAMQVLEDVSEDNLVRDMAANGRTLDFYITNLRELERAMGRQGEFLRTIKEGESEADRMMAVIEAMGKVIQSKVLADTAREGNGLSAAVNAFLDWLRKIAAEVKAMFELGEAINKVLTDKEAAAKMDPEFVADVERLVQQDIEFLRELQLEDGLKAMQRVYKAHDEAMNDRRVKATTKVETPVLDAAEAEHGEEVRKEQAEREAVQAKVDADVAEAEAAIEDGEAGESFSVEFVENSFDPVYNKNYPVYFKTRSSSSQYTNGQKDPAPFFEKDGYRLSLFERYGHMEMFRLATQEERDIYKRWDEWKQHALEVLEAREKPEVFARMKKSLEDSDGVVLGTLKKRIEQGVLEAPEYYTATARKKAIQPIRDKASELSKEYDNAVTWYEQMKRTVVGELLKERGFFVEEDRSRRSSSTYFYVHRSGDDLAWKIRLSDHNYPGLGNNNHLELRFWDSNSAIKDYIDEFVQRADKKDYMSVSKERSKHIAEARESFSVSEAKEAGLFKDGVLEARNAIVVEPDASFSVEALHVSTSRFRKFSTAFVGTGEGHQNYGWGLYFMTDEELNRVYYEGMAEDGEEPVNYRVELNVDDLSLIEWDEMVPEWLCEAATAEFGSYLDPEDGATGEQLYDDLVDSQGSAKEASKWLVEHGVKGIKYLDGTYCYVIFDDADIKLTGVNETGSFDAPWQDYEDETASFSVREEAPPTNTGIGYKVFYQKDGKLYPPMVANPGGADTPIGVWLNADEGERAGTSKTGRPQVKAGGKGTQGGSGKLAYRPGWHLGKIPYALQFNRKNPVTGKKDLFPKDFVWAEVEYAADVNYQDEAMSYGVNQNGKFQHSLAGLPKLPKDGYYEYRTNPNPATDPWIITGAMKVLRVLSKDEVDDMVRAAGREPQKVQGDDASFSVTDSAAADYDDGQISFNVVSARDEDALTFMREQMRMFGLSDDKIEEFIDRLERTTAIVEAMGQKKDKKGKLKYGALARWNERDVLRYKAEGLGWIPAVSFFVKNGDYPVNMDAGTICVKREPLVRLVNKLVKDGLASRIGVTQMEQLKGLLRRHGVVTGCDICFVEARRIRALQQASQLAFFWNAVRKAIGIEGNKPIGKNGILTEEQQAKLSLLAGDLTPEQEAEWQQKSEGMEQKAANKLKRDMVKANQTAAYNKLVPSDMKRVEKMDLGLSQGTMLKIVKIFQNAPTMAGKAEIDDFLSSESINYMLKAFPGSGIRTLLTSAFGAGTAKPLEDFNLYDELSWRAEEKDKLRSLQELVDQTFKMGGARIQSFSDFNPLLFLDYYQMLLAFEWRMLPLQTYTKVPSFVALFGETGAKINMSLIPEVVDGVDADHAGLKRNKNGEWEFAWHKDSFTVDLAFQFREDERMHANVGVVAVGISTEHVLRLLRDGRIDYVIPLHKSGMPLATQITTGLNKARDFTDVQTTRRWTMKNGKKALEAVTVLKNTDKKEDAHKRLSKTFNERLMELGDAKLAAADYLRECDEKGFIPAFDEFRNEENYYKLLVDFRVYDKYGKPAPQGVVQAKLPTNWAAIWEKAVGSREAEETKVETVLQEDSLMAEARDILDVTPLEGKVRSTLVDKLRTALGGKDKVEFLNSSDFTTRARELSGAKTAFRKANGEVYGFTHGGTIILREDSFNANTPAHEFVHIWAKVAQKANPNLWLEGVALLKKTSLWGNVKADALYQGIRDDDNAVAGEVLARFAASYNDQLVQELTDPSKKQLQEKGILARVLEWVRTIWKDVRSLFGKVDKRPLTLQEFTKMPLCDLWVKTRNTKFRNYLQKNPLEEREELEQAEADFSASIVSIDENELVADVAAAGSGFRANLEFSRQIAREASGALERLKRLGSKTRTEREDAIAAMGTVVQVVKAAVAYLPKGYRFSLHPYLKKLEVLAELASTGDVEMTKDMANKTIKEWLKLNKGIDDVVAVKGQELDRQTAAEELAKEYGEMHLQDALEVIMRRVAGQLRKHAKDKTVLKIKQLVDRIKPRKDKKTGKMKGGKMSADSYRDIEEVAQAMAMGDDELEDKLAALNRELETPGLSEDRRAQIESQVTLYDQFGNLNGMTPEETVDAYEALRQRVWYHRFEWDNVMAERRAARKEVIRRVVDGVGSVGINEYNEKKRVLKPSKRLKHVADILSGMPSVLTGLKGFLPLREMADDLSRRANRAGEQLKRWEAERWLELEALSRKTLGKSWRKSMDYMHEVLPTGVAFDRPKYRTVSLKTDALRELLAMSKEDRKAEMKRRREAGGLEAETALSERDVAELSKVLNAMEQNDRVLSTVEARYVVSVDHEDNLRLSRGNALYAILMYEQPTYTERLEAQGYTPEVIAGLKRFVGHVQLQFGYGLRDMLAKQGDRIAAVYERVFGVPFPREEKYFAARWNVTEMKANSAEQLLAGMAGTPGASNGWMKQRVKHDLELDMTKDALQVFLQATSLTDTWMATQDIVADFKAYTRDADFDRAMVATLGAEGYENLKDWVRILEQGGVQDCLNMGASQDVINGLYGAGAVVILGFRIQTLLRQLPAVLNGLLGAHDITTAEYFAVLSKLKRGEAPMTYKRMKNSTLLKNRQQGVAGNMASQAMRSGDIASSAAEGLLLASMLPMEKVDAACTAFGLVPVWNVYYQRAISKGASVQEAEQAAWEQTTEVANLASQPIGWLNKSKIAQSRNPLVKSVFYMLSENTAKFAMARALWRGGHKLASVRSWLFYGAANAIISALLDALQGDPEKWEEAKWWEYVLSAIYGPAASLPFIGELLEAIGSMVLNVAGEAFDVEELKKARMRASVGRALVDARGSWRAANKLYEMITDNKDHTLAEYTRAASTISRTMAIGTGWLGNAVGYWSTVVAVLMNPIDFGARVWRNLRHYFG